MLNNVGKTFTIFIILTLILLISSTCIGFYLYHQEERVQKTTQSALDVMRTGNEKLQAQLKDIQGQLALAMDKNKEADQKINSLLDEQDLNKGLRDALKKENAQIKKQMENIEASKQKIKSDLDDSMSKISTYRQLLDASKVKNKELQSQLDRLAQENKNIEAKLASASPNPGEASAKPGDSGNKVELGKIVVNAQDDSGHILSVDTNAQFVVFNLGLKQGIKPDALFGVYRGSQYLGDVKVTRVQDDMSAADIIPPLSSKGISNNDTVVPKP